ncbi:DUF2304 domain-containing protein [Gorillibacterium sp. sgz5001074]|uniref:DUF2304 domain-containing protein n=1 Tax=Gorillibacterium sp. sgz5001074 TaxID=3446695 RepID=UPI003F67E261
MNVYEAAAVFCLSFLIATVELIRRRKIEERYALLWLVLGLSMTVFCFFPGLLERLSRIMHVHYAPSLLFLIGLLFSLAFTLHLTMVISKLHRRTTRLAQELAILKAETPQAAARREGA